MTIYQDTYNQRSISNLKITNNDLFNDIIEQTGFLNDIPKVTHRQRLWHIVHNMWRVPVCKMCQNPVKWQTTIRNYSSFCSYKCIGLSQLVKEKRKQTCTDHYGVDSFSKTDQFKQRKHSYDTTAALKQRKQTCVVKYGAESYFQSEIGKSTIKSTIQHQYGVDNVRKSPQIINKIKQTIHNKYGVDHYNHTKEYKDMMCDLHADPKFKAYCITKQQRTMMQRYNCSSIHLVKLTDVQRSNLMDIGWLTEQHHDKQRTITDISIELNVDKQTVLAKFHTNNIKIYRYQSSMMERELSDFISSHVDIVNHDREILKPKELDIYIPSHNIAVEFNGLFWHSDQVIKDKWYHYNKTQQCANAGIQLIHIFEDDWVFKSDIVKQMLLHKLGKSNCRRQYARHGTCVKVKTNIKKRFFDDHHIQGDGPTSIQYGLMVDDELVGVMGFIMKSNGTCYLNRYATKHIVIGGFSKLFQHFIKHHDNISTVISFANREISNGNVYAAAGFTLDVIMPPDYSYVIDDQRRHKSNFQKSVLRQIFDDYDDNLSETEMMKAHNIPRIWNAGLLRYVYNTHKKGE